MTVVSGQIWKQLAVFTWNIQWLDMEIPGPVVSVCPTFADRRTNACAVPGDVMRFADKQSGQGCQQ